VITKKRSQERKKMDKNQKRINEMMALQNRLLSELQTDAEKIREEWRAADGGLTMVASDSLATINLVAKEIKDGYAPSLYFSRDVFGCNCGEQDAVEAHIRFFGAADDNKWSPWPI
jgi:hypothetical protein